MRQFHLNNKVVHQYQSLDAGYRDHVYILDKCFDKLQKLIDILFMTSIKGPQRFKTAMVC